MLILIKLHNIMVTYYLLLHNVTRLLACMYIYRHVKRYCRTNNYKVKGKCSTKYYSTTTVPQTIRFQNSLFCLLIVYILRCASASIGMYYISK